MSKIDDFILVTMPKTGTMLTGRLINVITKKKMLLQNISSYEKKNEENITSDDCILYINLHNIIYTKKESEFLNYLNNNKNGFFLWHTPYSKNFEIFLKKNNITPIFLIRDLRNVVISRIKNIKRVPVLVNSYYYDLQEGFNNFDINDKIDILLDNKKFIKEIKNFINWIYCKNVLILKFENLTNSNSDNYLKEFMNKFKIKDDVKLNDLKKIFNTKIENEKIRPNCTFSGELSNWNLIYNEENKNKFKKILGKELILWNYEKDNSW